jgi:hypothetical protein
MELGLGGTIGHPPSGGRNRAATCRSNFRPMEAGPPSVADEITKVVSIVAPPERLPERRLFARLDEVALADLIQLSGQRADRSVLRVTSGGQSGYLYFDAGLLYSATFEAATGLPALAGMLELESGTLQSCEQPWPMIGNIQMDPAVALLRATNFRDAGELTRAPSTLERDGVRTVDSMELGDAAAPERQPDAVLARLSESFYARCRRLGGALGLARLDSARLTDERWIFLLFHDARSNRLSAVLGARGPSAHAGSGTREIGSDGGLLSSMPRSLSELRGKPGIIAAFGGAVAGEPFASNSPGALRSSQLAEAISLCAQVLDCSRELGFDATAGELRFAGRRLIIARSGDRWVAVLAVSSITSQWLRELTVHLARRARQER